MQNIQPHIKLLTLDISLFLQYLYSHIMHNAFGDLSLSLCALCSLYMYQNT